MDKIKSYDNEELPLCEIKDFSFGDLDFFRVKDDILDQLNDTLAWSSSEIGKPMFQTEYLNHWAPDPMDVDDQAMLKAIHYDTGEVEIQTLPPYFDEVEISPLLNMTYEEPTIKTFADLVESTRVFMSDLVASTETTMGFTPKSKEVSE